jgi:RNA polymerase sigma-70 factor (ECF subfamily)
VNKLISVEDRFLEVLENNKKLIFKIASSYCRDPEDKKDLIQEIVLQLYRAFPKYNNVYSITTWIYRIALNISISFYRKEKTRRKIEEGYIEVIELADSRPDEKDEQLKMLYDFIELLNPIDKAIIILYMEGRKNMEIAEIMGFSTTNISTRLNRIKSKLSTNVKSLNN